MLPRLYEGQNCSIARTLSVVGDRWTLLVVRDALRGTRRFDDFLEKLGIARNVLSDRLGRLCDEGVLERVPYQEKPTRYEYRPTAKGLDLWPVIMSLLMWGDHYLSPEEGPPLLVEHQGCGGRLTPRFTCDACGSSLGPENTGIRPAATSAGS